MRRLSHQVRLCDVRPHTVTDQDDRQTFIAALDFLSDGMAVRDKQFPAVFAAQITQLVGVLAMATMVVAINRHASGSGCRGESCIAIGMLAKSMKYLHDRPRWLFWSPFLQVNLVTVFSFQDDAFVLSRHRSIA